MILGSPMVPSLKYVEVQNLSSIQTFSNSILLNKSKWMARARMRTMTALRQFRRASLLHEAITSIT